MGAPTFAASTDPPDWICVVWVLDDGDEAWICERVVHLDPNLTATACQNGETPPDCLSWEAFEPPPPPTFDSTGIGGGDSDDDAPPPPPDEEPGDCDDSPEGCEEDFNEEPTLVCSATVLRGQPMTCELNLEGNDIDGTDWEATLQGGFQSRDQGSSTEVVKWWSGPLAVGIAIELDLYKDGGVVKSFTRLVSVEPRSWGWQAGDNSVFKLREVTTPIDSWHLDVPEASNVEGSRLGGSSMDPTQDYGLIRPDPDSNESVESGYTASVPIPVGPNEGLVYVDTAAFESRRWWSINTHYLPSVSSQWSSQSCGTENWHDLNVCADTVLSPSDTVFSTDVQSLYQGIEDHEGRGENNSGQGHQAFVEQVATQSHIDPCVGVENLVAETEGELSNRVTDMVIDRNGIWHNHWVEGAGTPNAGTQPSQGSNWGPLTFYFPDPPTSTLFPITLPGGE